MERQIINMQTRTQCVRAKNPRQTVLLTLSKRAFCRGQGVVAGIIIYTR